MIAEHVWASDGEGKQAFPRRWHVQFAHFGLRGGAGGAEGAAEVAAGGEPASLGPCCGAPEAGEALLGFPRWFGGPKCGGPAPGRRFRRERRPGKWPRRAAEGRTCSICGFHEEFAKPCCASIVQEVKQDVKSQSDTNPARAREMVVWICTACMQCQQAQPRLLLEALSSEARASSMPKCQTAFPVRPKSGSSQIFGRPSI